MAAQETTFRKFTPEQAANYAAGRGESYPAQIYDAVLDYHKGKREAVLDVGTGPGFVARDFLRYFDAAIGCDASKGMIEQAKKDAETNGVADSTTFIVAGAEDCASAVAQAGREHVDAIIVATAAHWFDMQAFYPSAAKVLRPGGTLAMWVPSSLYVHPSVPNAKAIQDVLFDLENNMLRPYMQPGSLLARSAYDDLPLPWVVSGDNSLFDQATFQRHDWDRDGVPSAPSLEDGPPGPFIGGRTSTLAQAEKGLGSSSPVIRWREAHPEKARTEEDPVKLSFRRLQEVAPHLEHVVVAPSYSLLLMRRT